MLLLPVMVALASTHSATATSFGDSPTTHSFLPALAPEQILLQELWTQMAENTTIEMRRLAHNRKNGSDKKESTIRGLETIAKVPSSNDVPRPTSPARLQETYDLASSLSKRDGACGSQHTACSAQGFPGFCCTTVAACSRDYYGSIACCPYGAVCTGSVAAGAQQTSTPTTTTTYQQTATTTTAGLQTTGGAGFIQVSGYTVATVGSGTSGAASDLANMPWRLLMLGMFAMSVRMMMMTTTTI